MSSRVFIARPPSHTDLEAFQADLLLPEATEGAFLQNLKAKCRELARAESALLVSPTPQSLSYSFSAQLSLWIVAKIGVLRDAKVTARLKQLNIKLSHKVSVSNSVLQTCYQFTLIARLAPKWNQVSRWLVKGSDFLTTSKAQAINLEVGVTDCEVTLNLSVRKLSFSPLKPEDLNLTNTVLQLFRSNPDYVIQETSIYSNRCILLPNFSYGYIYSASHHCPTSPQFPSYDRVRLHWKKQHGIVLPEKQEIFYQVFFKRNSKMFFSYPGCCVFKTTPTSYPSREADPVASAFVADVHARLPSMCGTVMRYSSKALMPLASLHSAVERDNRRSGYSNLKPVELIPEIDLSQIPIPQSMRLHPPVAALPNESASLGAQPIATRPQQEVVGGTQTKLTDINGSQLHSFGVPAYSSQHTATGQIANRGLQARNMYTSQNAAPPPLNEPSKSGCGTLTVNSHAQNVLGSSSSAGNIAAMATGSASVKVLPVFGKTRQTGCAGLSSHKQTPSRVQVPPPNTQPAKKKPRLSLQPLSQRESKGPPAQSGRGLTGSAQQNPLQHHAHVVSGLTNAVGRTPVHYLKENDHPSTGGANSKHTLADSAGQSLFQPKGAVQTTGTGHGVSDTVMKKISKCKVAVLKKWLQENGMKPRSKDKKDELTRLVVSHLQQTGKVFEVQ